MTPINPAAAGGLPRTYAQSVDPSQPGFVDPYSTGYDQYSAPYETTVADQYGSAVAGTQPATTGGGPVASLDDFAALGVFTEDELVQLARMNLPPEELGAIYQETVAYMQTPEFAQLVQGQQGPQWSQGQQGPQGTQGTDVSAAEAPAAGGEPAWNEEWAAKFTDMMKEQGLHSKTRMMVIASLRQSGLSEAELTQGFEYYANTPEGKAELQAQNEQAKAATAQQDKLTLTMGVTALGLGGIATALGASRGNLVRALERTAAGTGDRASAAARALTQMHADRPLTTALRAEIVSTLRGEARAMSRLRHPFAKASLNAGARHLTPASRIGFKEAMKYGLGMRFGNSAADAADAARAVAGGADDVAKGVSRFGKFGKVIGPVGIAVSAAFGIWGIKKTMEAEGEFGEESAKMTGNVAGGIAGGVAGAAAGAAIGAVALPVLGAPIGAIVGGIAGSIGVGKIGESVGGFLHGVFD